jgi:hypothetical protein
MKPSPPSSQRVAPTREPGRPQRGPYTGRGARTAGLVGDRTRAPTPSPRFRDDGSSTTHRQCARTGLWRERGPAGIHRIAGS